MAEEILHQSENMRRYCGSAAALRLELGIEAESLYGTGKSCTFTATGKDGHQWTVRNHSGLFNAERPETPEEIKAGHEALERRSYSGYFTVDRQKLCADIAWQIRWLALNLKPDNPPSRAKRRQLKADIHEFGVLQTELLLNPRADVKAIRSRLAQI